MVAPAARLTSTGNFLINGTYGFDEATYDPGSTYSKNLCAYSQSYVITGSDNGWRVNYGSAIVKTNEIAPDGTPTAARIRFGQYTYSSVTTPFCWVPNLTLILSAWVRVDSGTRSFFFSPNGGGFNASFTATSTWTRVSVPAYANYKSYVDGINLFVNDGIPGGEVLIWGMQIEIGNVVTDYEPTGASAYVYIPPGFTTRLDPTGFYTIGSFDEVSINNTTSKGTNLLGGSQSNFSNNTNWGQSANYNIIDNSVVAPDGTLTGSTVWILATSNALPQYVTVIPATTYTFSFYAIRGTATNLTYSVFDNINGINILAGVSYYSQLNSQTWTRVSLTFTTPATCTSIRVYPIRDNGVLGSFYLWGAQLEVGAAATDYVPTNTNGTPIAAFVERKASTGLHRIAGQYDEVSRVVNPNGLVYYIDPGNPASYNPNVNPGVIYNIAPQGTGSKIATLFPTSPTSGLPTYYTSLGYGSFGFVKANRQCIITHTTHQETLGSGSGNYTISVWFYCTTPVANTSSYSPYNGETILAGGFAPYFTSGGSPGGCDIYIARNNDAGVDQMFVGFWTSPGKDYIVGMPYQLNQWQMVTLQVSTVPSVASTITGYMNGVQSGVPLTGIPAPSNAGGYIANEIWDIGFNPNGTSGSTQGGGNAFNGNVGMLTIYNRALSSAEIFDIFSIQRVNYGV